MTISCLFVHDVGWCCDRFVEMVDFQCHELSITSSSVFSCCVCAKGHGRGRWHRRSNGQGSRRVAWKRLKEIWVPPDASHVLDVEINGEEAAGWKGEGE